MQITTNKTLIILCVFFLIFIFHRPVMALDWAYECGNEAKEIYAKKKIQIPCSRIDDLLKKNDINRMYIAIRDAALFEDKTCDIYIKKNLSKLKKLDGVKDAVAFYSYKNGDPAGLKLLAGSFDKDQNDFAVDLFGFLDDWQISGIRLIRYAKFSDASGSEQLCSAIMWRRYLYGEKNFKHFWFKIGKKEKVNLKVLQHFFDYCHQ
jgi:hypothetical protein